MDRAIRAAAIDALVAHGEAATLNSVAQAAGLSRRSVYARYASKTGLFLDVIRDMMASAQGVGVPAAGNFESRLSGYVRVALEHIATPTVRAIQRLLTADPAYIAALRDEMQTATRIHLQEPLRGLLQEACDAGEIICGDVGATTTLLTRLILAESMMPADAAGPPASATTRDSRARFITTLVTRGLLPRSQPR
jgi:TetR/AcrR family transcriptional regulator, mexJK operon transcriptional repressor